jgi:hypothetical protein
MMLLQLLLVLVCSAQHAGFAAATLNGSKPCILLHW